MSEIFSLVMTCDSSSPSQNATKEEPPSAGSHTRIGRAPVTCVTMVNETVWCGCGNNVVILNERYFYKVDRRNIGLKMILFAGYCMYHMFSNYCINGAIEIW